MSTAEVFRDTGEPACPTQPFPGGRGWQRRYESALRVADVAIILSAVGMAQWLRFGEVPAAGHLFDRSYTAVSVVVAAIWAMFLTIYRARAPKILGAGPDEYRRVAAATISAFGTVAIVAMLAKVDLARGYLAIALPLGLMGLLVGRRAARWLIAKKRRDGLCLTSVLVVGEPAAARALAQSLARTPEYGYRVVGLCFPGGNQRASRSFFDGVPTATTLLVRSSIREPTPLP
jgi:FlaA1/EpsC-like NDP-sugar epimerase